MAKPNGENHRIPVVIWEIDIRASGGTNGKRAWSSIPRDVCGYQSHHDVTLENMKVETLRVLKISYGIDCTSFRRLLIMCSSLVLVPGC